jgi:TRAP-type C4-dicarboxylate transport system substrate-binding protein
MGNCRMWKKARKWSGVACVALIVASCSSTSSGSHEGSGGSGSGASASTAPSDGKSQIPSGDEPITLKIGWFGTQHRANSLPAELFVEEIAKASSGKIKAEVQFDDADALQHFHDGQYDLVMSPANAMDSVGVHGFDALSLPFTVLDDDQADRVVASDAVAPMMKSVSSFGATGLLLAPIDEMHLVLQGDAPLTDLSQMKGGIRVSPPGDLTAQMYAQLGAKVQRGLNNDDWTNAVAKGTVVSAEFPTSLAGLIPAPSLMATNFAIYYRFEVLMIRTTVAQRLGDGAMKMLQAAADATTARVVHERKREADVFRDVCTSGIELSAASATLVDDIGRALAPWILARFAADPALQSSWEAVRRAAGVHKVTEAQVCHSGSATAYVPAPPPSSVFPEGTYRTRPHERMALRVAGVTDATADPNDAWDFAELRFDKGSMSLGYHHRGDAAVTTECTADYKVAPDGLLSIAGDCLGGTYTWRTTKDGIALEQMPPDPSFVQALQDGWDVSKLITSDLVAVK